MNFDHILDELRSERTRIEKAIAALEKVAGGGHKTGRKRRHMSAAARRKISQMMKLRWAERRKKSRAA